MRINFLIWLIFFIYKRERSKKYGTIALGKFIIYCGFRKSKSANIGFAKFIK
nr:MAG TPA: hypothetical protein [Caudoviricetes sp.]